MIGAVPEYVTPIVVAIATGGFLGGAALYIKARPEAGKITIDAAQGAVVVQSGVIETLNKENQRISDENERLKERLTTLEERMVSFSQMHARIQHLERENTLLKDENLRLTGRVAQLEADVHNGGGNG